MLCSEVRKLSKLPGLKWFQSLRKSVGKGRLTHPQHVWTPGPATNTREQFWGNLWRQHNWKASKLLEDRFLVGPAFSHPELKNSVVLGPEQSTLLSVSSATLRDKVKFVKTLSNDNPKPDEEATKLLYCYSCSEFKDEQASTHPAGRPRGQEVRDNGGAHCLAYWGKVPSESGPKLRPRAWAGGRSIREERRKPCTKSRWDPLSSSSLALVSIGCFWIANADVP